MKPFPTSRCHSCIHVKLVPGRRGSVFILCRHPELPRYAPQPIVECAFHSAREPGEPGDGEV